MFTLLKMQYIAFSLIALLPTTTDEMAILTGILFKQKRSLVFWDKKYIWLDLDRLVRNFLALANCKAFVTPYIVFKNSYPI